VASLGCSADLGSASPSVPVGTPVSALCPRSCATCAPSTSSREPGLRFEAYDCALPGVCAKSTPSRLRDTGGVSVLESTWNGMKPSLVLDPFNRSLDFANAAAFLSAIPALGVTALAQTYFRWSGYLRVNTTATYMFRTRSDDGSRVYIDGRLVVDNDGWHGMRNRDGTASNLASGWHRITVAYYAGRAGNGLQVWWKPSGEAFEILRVSETKASIAGLQLELYALPPGVAQLSSWERGVLSGTWGAQRQLAVAPVFTGALGFSSAAQLASLANVSGTLPSPGGGLLLRWRGQFYADASGQWCAILCCLSCALPRLRH
jgi:hypothetical protein